MCKFIIYNGAAWLNMGRRGSEWGGVAQYGAAWLSWQRVGLLQGRPEFDFWLGPTGKFPPLSTQAMRIWREASANGDG